MAPIERSTEVEVVGLKPEECTGNSNSFMLMRGNRSWVGGSGSSRVIGSRTRVAGHWPSNPAQHEVFL